jgi:tripartite-type tricarboxylate transporter receptor subunit TctC
MHTYSRRLLLACAAAVPLSVLPQARADEYPARPITIVVPYSPGSGTDQLARMIAQDLSIEYKVPVIVDDKPGANGFIGAQQVARAAPDGYTWFLTGNTTQSANEFLLRKLPYDPVRDFTPVTLLSKGYMVLVVKPSSPVTSVDELVALARKSPGKLNFGSGTASGRIAAEMFRQMTGIAATHVPYKSNPPALNDLLAGQIDFMFTDAPTAVPQVAAGKLRAIGVTSSHRLGPLANVPTMAETGLKGYEWAFWLGMYLPAGAPAPLVQRVNEMLRKFAETPQYKAFQARNAGEVAVSSPEGLARFQAAESEKTGRVVRAAGIEPE